MLKLYKQKSRFSLVLLDEREYYFDDFSAYFYPPSKDDDEMMRKRVKGRLLLCSHSLFFDPEDIRLPITKFKFSDLISMEPWHAPLTSTAATKAEIFIIRSHSLIEMKENNANHVFRVKKGPHEYKFSLTYEPLPNFLSRVRALRNLVTLSREDSEQMIKSIIEAREKEHQFDPSWLVDLNERQLLDLSATRVQPLVVNPGHVMITNQRLYYQPINNIDGVPVHSWRLGSIVRMAKRRHALRQVGIEFFFEDESSLFLTFRSPRERDTVYDALLTQPEMLRLQTNDQSNMALKWQNGIISNFDYLMYLNVQAGRTFNDLTQYPVFPWIITDFKSDVLDLTNPATLRDLSKPIGALNPQRLAVFKQRYDELDGNMMPKFLYGTHYSAPAYVLYYLVRLVPEFMLRMQSGRFDSPDRMFHSLQETWHSVYYNTGDVKELIPEFYHPQSAGFLINSESLDMGTKSNGARLGDVLLPNWASDAQDFVEKMREALESDYASENLHHWIDLIFGFKQIGQDAVDADNVFNYLSYEGAVDIDAISDPLERAALEAQINEFGQTPKQLFTRPHPQRLAKPLRRKIIPELATSSSGSNFSSPLSQSSSLSSSSLLISSPAVATQPPPAIPFDLGSDDTSVTSATPWGLMRSFTEDFNFRLHKDAISAACLNSKLDTIYTVSLDSSLKIYSLAEKRQLRSINLCDLSLSSLQLSPDEKSILIGSWDNNIYVYSVDYGRVSDTIAAHDDSISCLRLRGDFLVSGSWDSTVKVWRYSAAGISKVPVVDFVDAETEIKCVDIDPEANVCVSGAEDGSVLFHDLRAKRHIRTVHAHSDVVHSVKFSADGGRVVTCSGDRHVKVIELRAGETFLKDAKEPLNCLDTDGTTVILGGDSGVVRIWDLATGDETAALRGHNSKITCVSAATNGSCFVSAAQNGTMYVWRKANT